jgi:hypothetical protein
MPIKSKPDALKAKRISKIQVVELIFLIKLTKGKFLDIQTSKFEDEQLIRYFWFQFQFFTIIKSGLASLIAFDK